MISKKLLIGGLALTMSCGAMSALATEGVALAGSQPATYTACVSHSTGALYWSQRSIRPAGPT